MLRDVVDTGTNKGDRTNPGIERLVSQSIICVVRKRVQSATPRSTLTENSNWKMYACTMDLTRFTHRKRVDYIITP